MADPTTDDAAPRQLVVCCDGTNNTLTAGEKDTNVLKLVAHLAHHPSAHRRVYYDPGVGSADAAPPTGLTDWAKRTWQRVSGLASGQGVYDNIALAYLFLMQNWRDERDQIYCFGFSRGAFTARAVAGMVNLFGVVKPEHEALLPTLLHIYFSQPRGAKGTMAELTRKLHASMGQSKRTIAVVPAAMPQAAPVPHDERARLGAQVRELFTTPQGGEAWVHWVGVWDTVESVGLPGPLSRSNPSTATLHDKRIRHARHALSLDEHRWTFVPRLYDEPGDIAEPPPGHTLKQRWFPGVHCDVGGGYVVGEAALSNGALEWMVNEVAVELGIPPWPAEASTRVRHDALWDTPWWALAGMCLRDVRPSTGSVTIAAYPSASAGEAAGTVWATRRALWPLAVAVIMAVLCLVLSGACLTPEGGWRAVLVVDAATLAALAADFAADQLASLWGAGLLVPGNEPWSLDSAPGWAMFWDLGFILGWGYVLARISSRGFAWLAARRSVNSTLPAWRVLGMTPLMAVGGDGLEDFFTLAALAAHAASTDVLADVCLWAAGASALVKWLGLIGCVPWLLLRLAIALPGVQRSRG